MSKDLKHFVSAFLAALAVFGALGILILSRPETVKSNAARSSAARSLPSSDVQSTQQMATTASASERLAGGDGLPVEKTVSAESQTPADVTRDAATASVDFVASAERITPSIWSTGNSVHGMPAPDFFAHDQLNSSIHASGGDQTAASSSQTQQQPQTSSSALQKMYMDGNGRIRTAIYTPEELHYRLLYGWVAFNAAQLQAVNSAVAP